MANTLVYQLEAAWSPVLYEGLDLVSQLTDSGHKVFWAVCRGDLVSCACNYDPNFRSCFGCKRQAKYQIREVLPDSVSLVEVGQVAEGEVEIRRLLSSARSVSELLRLTYQGMPLGRLIYSQLVDQNNDLLGDFEGHFESVMRLGAQGIGVYQWAQQTLVEKQIQKAFIWNGRRTSDGPVWWAAKDLGIEAYTFAHGLLPQSCLISKDWCVQKLGLSKEPSRPVGLAFPTRIQSKKLAAYLLESQRTGRPAHAGYVDFAQSVKSGKQASPFQQQDLEEWKIGSKPKLLFFSSSIHEFAFLEENFFGGQSSNSEPSELYAAIYELLSDNNLRELFNVAVRWHPNLVNAGLNEQSLLEGVVESSPFVVHVLPDSAVSSYELLDLADVIVTMGSTIGLEAATNGKPVIEFYAGLSNLKGATHRAESVEDVVRLASRFKELKPTGDLAIEYVSDLIWSSFSLRGVGEEPGKVSFKRSPLRNRLSHVARIIRAVASRMKHLVS